MSETYRYSIIKLAMASSVLTTMTANAAGLEYTKQNILPFFEEGNYAEISYAYVDVDVEGTDVAGGLDVSGDPIVAGNNEIKDMMDDFDLFGAAIKVAPTENTALALIYDEPFGVDTIYPSGSDFSNHMGTTEARLDTQSLTLLGGGKFDNNVWLYGGLEYQEVEGSVQLAQPSEAGPIYYDLDVKTTSDALIPVVGIAYEIPEIMLRAAVTWRGEGDHSFKSNESFMVDVGSPGTPFEMSYNDITGQEVFGDGNFRFKMPQSVNFDFQTGLSEKYQLIAMLNARWVEWTAFNLAPTDVTQVFNEPLAEYEEDAYAIELALGKQFTPKFAAEIRAGYDSGTAEPLSLLGPYDSIKTLALGGSYDVTDNFNISAGAQYLWLEGGTAYSKLPIDKSFNERIIANFEDGDGYALGVKLGYYF